MRSSEGNVYLCSWSKKRGEFKITLKADRHITVTSDSFGGAEELMWELLCEKFGDGEAVIEYDKSLPKTQFAEYFGKPEILCISGNGSVGRMLGSPELYSGGYCKKCQRPLGQRNKQSAGFASLPSADGAVVFEGYVGNLFSEDFLSLLSVEEQARLSFLPVIGPDKSRKNFFELVGKPSASHVGIPSFPGRLNKRCDACGKLRSHLYLYRNELFQFVALRDLPEPIPSVFVIGDEIECSLCMTRERYQKIIGKKGSKDIVSRQIWVVSDDKFVRRSEDESYPEEFYWKAGLIEVPLNSPSRHLIPREVR
jgi:hypothetical protein